MFFRFVLSNKIVHNILPQKCLKTVRSQFKITDEDCMLALWNSINFYFNAREYKEYTKLREEALSFPKDYTFDNNKLLTMIAELLTTQFPNQLEDRPIERPTSLKALCRICIAMNNLPVSASVIPEELVTYLEEIQDEISLFKLFWKQN
jgi:hypothetical protein